MDQSEEKLAKAHPSDIEAATRYGWDKDDDHSPFNFMREAFLAGCAHARKDQEHLIREARPKEDWRRALILLLVGVGIPAMIVLIGELTMEWALK